MYIACQIGASLRYTIYGIRYRYPAPSAHEDMFEDRLANLQCHYICCNAKLFTLSPTKVSEWKALESDNEVRESVPAQGPCDLHPLRQSIKS